MPPYIGVIFLAAILLWQEDRDDNRKDEALENTIAIQEYNTAVFQYQTELAAFEVCVENANEKNAWLAYYIVLNDEFPDADPILEKLRTKLFELKPDEPCVPVSEPPVPPVLIEEGSDESNSGTDTTSIPS